MSIYSLTPITILMNAVKTVAMTFEDLKTIVVTGVVTFIAGAGLAMLMDYMKAPRPLTPEQIVNIAKETSLASNPYIMDKDRIFDRLLSLTQEVSKSTERFDTLYRSQQEMTITMERIKLMMQLGADAKKKGEEDSP